MIRPLAIVVAAATVLAPLAQGGADASATERTTVEGDVLRLTSIQRPEAMAAMRVGEPVPWIVGIQASRDAGSIEVLLEVEATDSAFDAAIDACDVEWSSDACATGAERIAAGPLQDGVLELGEHDAHGERWYRLDVALLPGIVEGRADLVVRAMGLGDELVGRGGLGESGDGGGSAGLPGASGLGGLAATAAGTGATALLAAAAIAGGILIARVGGRRRGLRGRGGPSA